MNRCSLINNEAAPLTHSLPFPLPRLEVERGGLFEMLHIALIVVLRLAEFSRQ